MKKIGLLLLCLLLFSGCQSSQQTEAGEVRVFIFGFGYTSMKPQQGYSVASDVLGGGALVTPEDQTLFLGKQQHSSTVIPKMIITPPSSYTK